MSEPFIKEAKKSSLLVKLLLGAVVVAAVAGLGVIAYKFISYKESGGIPTDTSFAQVAISYPPQGMQLELSDSVMVEAAAIGSKPFQSMELWINGEVLGVQVAPSGGTHPFSTFFSWLPVEPGVYSLSAAAIDSDGQKEMSAQVVVSVVQAETGIELVSSDSPTVLPAASGGGYSPPDKPDPGVSKSPAEIWSGSTGDWVTSLMAEVKPSAPELFVSAGECGALLQFHDMSDNEEGFAVYRQVGISPTWVKIATLSSQSDLDWITYIDEGIYGAVYYYVTSFNNKGESKSDYVFVSIDPTDCASENEEIAVGTLGVALDIPGLKAEKIYCYLSTDGVNWARSPQSGFMSPEGEGIQTEILALQLTGDGLGEEQAVPEMSLFMECWGWEGNDLQHLGKLETTHIQPQENGIQNIPGEGISGQLKFEIEPNSFMDSFFDIQFDIEGDLPVHLNQIGKLKATSPEIPRVYLSHTTDFELCMQHAPSDGNKLSRCFNYLEANQDDGGNSPQPFLVWDFDFMEPNCVGGVGEQCKTYWELLNMAAENGGQVGFNIIGLQDGKKYNWNVTVPNQTMFVVPPLTCLGGTEFSVRMWYRPGNKGVEVSASPGDQISEIGEFEPNFAEILYGPYSNWVSVPCSLYNLPGMSVIEQIQYLDITFESVEFFDLDDDDMGFQEVELYGYFRVNAPAMGHWYEEQCFFPEFGGCDNTILGTTPWVGTRRYLNLAYWEVDTVSNPGTGGLQVFGNDSYNLSDHYLCQSDSKYSYYANQSTAWKKDNNTIRVFVKDGDALSFEVFLRDYDELSANDTICIDTILTASKSLSQWSGIDSSYTIHTPTGVSGGCKVNISVIAVGDPVLFENP
jgi:hypothetical protein